MTIETLFGTEEDTCKPRTIRFKKIRAVYETFKVNEEVSHYLRTGNRYTAPAQIYETFKFLIHETKEHFLTLHLDGKNRVVCIWLFQ